MDELRKRQIIYYGMGIIGVVLLVATCALMPEVAVWATRAPAVVVYLGLFVVMMIAGNLLNSGVNQLFRDLRGDRSEKQVKVSDHES